jgi:hypothetical protein
LRVGVEPMIERKAGEYDINVALRAEANRDVVVGWRLQCR